MSGQNGKTLSVVIEMLQAFFLMAQHVDRPHIVVEPETGLLLLAALITTYRGLFIYADSKRLGPELLVVPLC